MKILKVLTDRIFIFGFLIFLQALGIILFTSHLFASYHWLKTLLFIFSLLIVLWLVNKDENPAYKISWIILILIFPIFGGLLYLFIGNKIKL